MAFATQNVKLESNGSLWQFVGECTSSVGDADGTITVAGARIYQAYIYDQSDTTPGGNPIVIKISEPTTGTTSTITVNCSNGITKGRFLIVYR